MTGEELKDTKEKIMQAARSLFAEKGFEGASVRDIAKTAQVNVAALNYHFTSKENLYLHVLKSIFLETSEETKKHRNDFPKESVEDFAVWLFQRFLERSSDLRATFKMFLSEKSLSGDVDCGGEEEVFGPPGGATLARAIVDDVGHEVAEKDLFWSVKMIFTGIVHLSLMYSNHFCKMEQEDMPYHTQAVLEEDIRRLVRVVLRDL